MTRRRMLIIGLAAALFQPPSALRAQVPGAGTGTPRAAELELSLEDAVTRALAASHRIEEARARGEAATAIVGARHAATRPQVAAVGGYTRTNHVDEFGILLPNNQLRVIYPDIPDNYRARLDVQYPIYTSGRLQAIERAAQLEATAAATDTDTTAGDVRLDVTRAFWTLVVARESQRVVDESLRRMGEHLRDVRNQFDAGLVPPNDVLTVQAQEARQRMLSIQARTSREMAEADLARLVGAAPGTAVVPLSVLTPPATEGTAEALLADARRNRPERQALEQRMAAAETRGRAAQAGRRPVVAVAGGVDYARPNPRIFPRLGEWRESWDAGINVSWPIFDGGRAKSEVAEASAGVRALQARLAEFDSMVALEIRQRLSELESSRAALDAADVAVRAATEARRVIGERFAAGVATSTDVVDAQVAILQAELDRTQAIAAARLADARLTRAVGR
ncbi:MAG: TolC family protein [Vicinamibacterales bacterium]